MTLQDRTALVYSVKDLAGSGVARLILEYLGGEEASCPRAVECWRLPVSNVYLAGYLDETVNFGFLDETPDPGATHVIVLSRHSSASGRPTLTAHHTGNPTRDNSHGGTPGQLAWSAPVVSAMLLQRYREKAEELHLTQTYEVSLEATHHGPTNNKKPLVFIEIGSTPEQWRDPQAREAMAQTVIDYLEGRIPRPECRIAAGFGGTHYPVKFTRLHLTGEYCMGHIIPKYAFQKGVPDNVILQAVTKAWPRPAEVAVFEKKSIKAGHRDMVIKALEEGGLQVEIVRV